MKKLILFLLLIWQLPQNLLGLYNAKKCKYVHKLNGRKIYIIDSGEGMSLGDYVFVQPSCDEGNLLRHEYGHTIQSRMLGPLYMLIIFIPSYTWWRYFSKYKTDADVSEYYTFYTESLANKLVAKKNK